MAPIRLARLQWPRCPPRIAALLLSATLAACAASPAYGPVPAGHYRVTSGDTLYGIARANRASTADLVRWNGLADPDKIEVGQVLRVVPPSGGNAPATDSAAKPAARPGTARPSAPTPDTPAARIALDWPASGQVIAGFNGSSNKGIDIGGNTGDPVTAAAPGKVVYAGHGLRGYGNLVMLQHTGGYLTAYAHNSRVLVTEGAQVSKGQRIAEMGSSDTDRVKLHFEVRQQGKPYDPMAFLPKK
ncbi:peptidase [Pandoraea terrae]|uniref:Peptidase n=1 Tax=Pandoraea terrae TaxID=1537710 RepID=A0A5E4TTG6_9BURK|nr:peptidase [Pandoraea terrae]